MDISPYKIKVVAGMATLINPYEPVDFDRSGAFTPSDYILFSEFATEYTFATDKTVPDGVYEGSMFKDAKWQTANLTETLWHDAEPRDYELYNDFKEFSERRKAIGLKTQLFRSFIGTHQPIETESESVEQAAERFFEIDSVARCWPKKTVSHIFSGGANWAFGRIGSLRNDEVDRIRKQAMQEQQEMLQQEWVSVEDRLPDNINIIDYVLVIIEGQKIPEIAYWNNEHKWWVTRQNHSAGKEIDKVIYWRALPPAPQSQRRIK